MNLVKLPSGALLNPTYISHVKYDAGEGITIHTISDEVFPETMTMENLLDLLHGPAIVDPVINLDKLKTGAGCSFEKEGTVRHGLIEYLEVSEEGLYTSILSDGELVTIDTRDPSKR